MSKRKRKIKTKEKNNKVQPNTRGYFSVKVLFFVFLALVFIRFVLFIAGEGQIQTNDLWLRFLMITLGTFIAWWFFRKREK